MSKRPYRIREILANILGVLILFGLTYLFLWVTP